LCGHHISYAPCAKLLGVKIDNCMNFREHVLSVSRSCNYHIHALRHVRHLLTQDEANAIAVSLVNSRLDYCNGILFGIGKGVMKQLQSIQNSAARVFTRASFRASSSESLRSLHWLPVEYRIQYKLANIAYGIRSKTQPKYLKALLHDYKPSRTPRSSYTHHFDEPRARTKLAPRAFSYSVPKIWNSLPLHVKEST